MDQNSFESARQDIPVYVDIARAAQILGLNPGHVSRLARRPGGLPSSKLGRSVRFRVDELIAFMESRKRFRVRA